MVRLPEKHPNDEDDHPGEPSGTPTLADLTQAVKDLIQQVLSTDINELHLESGPVRIIIKRGTSIVGPSTGPALPAQSYPPTSAVYTPPPTLAGPDASSKVNMIGQSHAHGEGPVLAEGEELIVAPMVGTFYAAPSPGTDPYVIEGDLVEPGQTVGIIEAMKMMNPIESDVAGVVSRVLVTNAQPVEYGQPLMIVSANA